MQLGEQVLIDQYNDIKPRYEKLCEETRRIISESFHELGLQYQNISARAKNTESFVRKALKKNGDEEKYSDPLNQITDIAGVRIITYTIKDLEKVDRFISGNFDIVEKRDVGEERYKEGKFGYQSIHYLVKFTKGRLELSEYKKYSGLICEIQIRTVLQHAWAEIEHDIQYKNQSDVPRSLERKFIALAGLLEIADREFQAIQDEDAKLKRAIDEQLQNEVTKGNISREDSEQDQRVAALVRAKRYADAILLYDRKIEESPNMHTLYLGRARAKFLLGNRRDALDDIDTALTLSPNDPMAEVLKKQFTEGSSEPSTIEKPASEENANDLTKKANYFIEIGDGISAFELYSIAQELGASKPFSQVNKAIACYVSDDFEGSKYYLESLQPRLGTPMSVTLYALRCLLAAPTEGQEFDESLGRLKEALNEAEDFTFSMSPLAKLKRGILSGKVSIDRKASKRIQLVFTVVDPAGAS